MRRAIDLARDLLAVRLVDEAQHGGGMRVVDERVRQEGVQQRLDRRVGRGRIEQVDALVVDHVLVGRAWRACAAASSGSSFTAGRPGGSIVPMSQPEPLTHSTLCVAPRRSVAVRLHRRIAAAVQHQQRVAAEQARRVDAQRRHPSPTPACRSAPPPWRRRRRSIGSSCGLAQSRRCGSCARSDGRPDCAAANCLGATLALALLYPIYAKTHCALRRGWPIAAGEQLRLGQPRVGAVPGHQLGMRADLDDRAGLHHADQVGALHRRRGGAR